MMPFRTEGELSRALPIFVGNFKNLKLDALEVLTVRFYGRFPGSQRNGAAVNKMFSTWHLPLPRLCTLKDVIPSSPNPKVYLDVGHDFSEDMCNQEPLLVNDLITFVGQHENLSELCIRICDDVFDVEDSEEMGNIQLTSSLLRNLTIKYFLADTADLVTCILRSFSLVALEEVTLDSWRLTCDCFSKTKGVQGLSETPCCDIRRAAENLSGIACT